MKVIVGLGNPGRKYNGSRHNAGFRCVDLIARKWDIVFGERRAKAVLGQGPLENVPVVLAKPRTYMNRSGEGVAYLLARFSASPQDLVIIYDDMDLSPGVIRIRPGGGAAGHNGIKSIIATLSSQEFPRVRVGIGKPPEGTEGMDYVLQPFSHAEIPVIEEASEAVAEAVACLARDGIQTAMNKFN